MRKKRFFYSTGMAILNQIITLLCGFILPKQILLAYGSEVNGLVSSITQFLGIITFLEMGVGAVVQSALYPALANNDKKELSKIVVSSDRFFHLLGKILVIYTAVLTITYPLLVNSSLGYWSTGFLVVSIALSSVAQYFFGVTNQLLLNADQKTYIQLIPQSVTTILNTVVSVILIYAGQSINTVKMGSAIVLLLRPIFLHIYVRRHYLIDYKVKYDSDPLSQKWNAMAQHIATFIVDRTDVVVLTLLSTLTNVSIYYVYHLVVQGLYQSFNVIMTGVQSLLGDMYAKNEIDKFKKLYLLLEWLVHTFITFIFTCCGILIVPFIMVYTNGVVDAEYSQPLFGTILSIAFAFCCFRSYYNIIIKAVAHYKQTQLSAVVEAIINIVLSLVLVRKCGLVGVAIGTLVAMVYRTISFEIHIQKNILDISYKEFARLLCVDIGCCSVYVLSTFWLQVNQCSYLAWGVLTVKVLVICLFECVLINLIFYKSEIKNVVYYFKTVGKR